MTKTAWALLILLVLSNAVWLLSRGGAPTGAPIPAVPVDATPPAEPAAPSPALARVAALEREVAEERATSARLREEVESYREIESVLWPKGEPGGEAAPPPARSPRRREAGNLPQRAWAIAQRWREAGLDVQDVSKRESAIETVRWALGEGDADQVLAALYAFRSFHDLEFDRQSFRPLILRQLESPEPLIRVAAIGALYSAGVEEGDLDRLLAMKDEPGLRGSFTNLVSWFTKGDIRGEAAKAVLEHLASGSGNELKQTIAGIGASKLSPELEARVIELGRQEKTRHDVIYFVLSGRGTLSRDAVRVMLDAMACEDWNAASRAIWGLRDSVPKELREDVADAFLAYLEARPNTGSKSDLLLGLGSYGVERHLEALEKMAELPWSDYLKGRLDRAIKAIRSRVSKRR